MQTEPFMNTQFTSSINTDGYRSIALLNLLLGQQQEVKFKGKNGKRLCPRSIQQATNQLPDVQRAMDWDI